MKPQFRRITSPAMPSKRFDVTNVASHPSRLGSCSLCSLLISSTTACEALLLPTSDLKALSAFPDSSMSCLNFSANSWRATASTPSTWRGVEAERHWSEPPSSPPSLRRGTATPLSLTERNDTCDLLLRNLGSPAAHGASDGRSTSESAGEGPAVVGGASFVTARNSSAKPRSSSRTTLRTPSSWSSRLDPGSRFQSPGSGSSRGLGATKELISR